MIASGCVAEADPFLYGALETTVPTFCHVAPRQSKYPTYSLLGVAFPAGLGCNSFPAAANAVWQSHRQRFGSEPRVGILFPYTWPMLRLLAVSKQQIFPFYHLPLLVSKQLLPKSSFFSSTTNRESFFNYSNWIPILLYQVLLLLCRASSSYVTVFGRDITFKALAHTRDVLPLLSPLPLSSKINILSRRSSIMREQAYLM